MNCCAQVEDQLSHLPRTITAGPSSPTLSLPAALVDSGEYGAAYAQQTPGSLPASSIPGSTARPHMRYGVLAPPLSGSRRTYCSDTRQGYTPQRRRRLSLPDASRLTVSTDQLMWCRLITAYLW